MYGCHTQASSSIGPTCMSVHVDGSCITVTGPMAPQDLGVVLPHEYTLVDTLWALKDAEYGMQKDLSDLSFELQNLGKIRQFPSVT